MLVFSSFWKWLFFHFYWLMCLSTSNKHLYSVLVYFALILKYSYANDIFLASWCLSRKASDFVNEWLSGTSTCWSFFCVTYESICIGFCCTSVCGFRICWRDCGQMSLLLIVVILFYLCSWYVILGFVCSHVGLCRSIIVFVVVFLWGVLSFCIFLCCTLDYFVFPVTQADVAFLTLFIGILGGKAWSISFGTNYYCSLITSPSSL